MARRTKGPSRVELRKQAESAEKTAAEKPAKAKKEPAKRPPRKKSSKRKAESHRVRIVWGVFDNSNQLVAKFPYPERDAAAKKAAEMTEKGRGPYFVQPVKEEIIEEAPAAEKK